ncbi:helix-turn-helix domain-containing protein (plasmid) [Halorussus salilacus]|uniref:helix-turn-helix domain-containing protein n=1 Tax=Halorussus salilacus TaxID=2953750 RepID=UPI00209EED37|nr:helix-turn-helix domain-containing protein [Halorussus salilacus]USZ69852.1 helix-turn-helix domain-containing protein [Halorussus salilacus]
MRAFAFALEHEPGADPVSDAFREDPDLYAHSLSCNVTPDHFWRVDRLVGPTAGLEAATAAFESRGRAVDCLGVEGPGAEFRFELLHRDPTSRVLFASWARTDGCGSIPHLALDHLGPGVLFATERREARYEWRVLLPDDAGLGRLYDALQAASGDDVSLDLRQVTDESGWLGAYSGRPALPYAQYETMRAAVERGYYETPREITVGELAEELDTPRSTLSYRLRRAEAELANSFVRGER